jgi:hypothetical protein
VIGLALPALVPAHREALAGDTGLRRNAEEPEDPGAHLLRRVDEILVPHAVALLRVRQGRGYDRVGVVVPVPGQGQDHVAGSARYVLIETITNRPPRARFDHRGDEVHRMPHQADELRLRVEPLEQPGVLRRPEALVTEALLVLAGQVPGHQLVGYRADPRQHLPGDRTGAEGLPGLSGRLAVDG